MTRWFGDTDVSRELGERDPEVLELAEPRDGTTPMLTKLRERYSSDYIGLPNKDRVWELSGLLYLENGRFHEALEVFFCTVPTPLGRPTRSRPAPS